MNAIEIVRLAIEMRAAQNAYFKLKTRDNLIASKQIEAKFDKAAADLSVSSWIRVADERVPELRHCCEDALFYYSDAVLVRYEWPEMVCTCENDLPVALATLSSDGGWREWESGNRLEVVAWMPVPRFEVAK